jgi:predicted nuclease of predicted toxin-antitoxin system
VKLLLDENLSPAAAVALRADGIDAYHVRDRGILGATDQELLERALVSCSHVGGLHPRAELGQAGR